MCWFSFNHFANSNVLKGVDWINKGNRELLNVFLLYRCCVESQQSPSVGLLLSLCPLPRPLPLYKPLGMYNCILKCAYSKECDSSLARERRWCVLWQSRGWGGSWSKHPAAEQVPEIEKNVSLLTWFRALHWIPKYVSDVLYATMIHGNVHNMLDHPFLLTMCNALFPDCITASL